MLNHSAFNKTPNKKAAEDQRLNIRGGEGTRTPVQTYPSKAFYMFISALIVGKKQGPDKPTISLAVWS